MFFIYLFFYSESFTIFLYSDMELLQYQITETLLIQMLFLKLSSFFWKNEFFIFLMIL